MLARLNAQKFGFVALSIVMVGFLGLLVPMILHWNNWIFAFAGVRRYILLPLAIAILGMLMDRPRRAAVVACLAAVAFYLSPWYVKLAGVMPQGDLAAWTIVCFVDQSGEELEHITLNVDGKPSKLPKNKYWSGVAKFACQPVTDTPELSLTADVGFVSKAPIEAQQIPTQRNGRHLRYALVFIRPDGKFDVTTFY